MGNIGSIVLEQLRTQGLSFILLGIAVWFLYGQNQKLSIQVKGCNETIIEMYRQDRKEMLTIINQNTQVLKELKSECYEE